MIFLIRVYDMFYDIKNYFIYRIGEDNFGLSASKNKLYVFNELNNISPMILIRYGKRYTLKELTSRYDYNDEVIYNRLIAYISEEYIDNNITKNYLHHYMSYSEGYNKLLSHIVSVCYPTNSGEFDLDNFCNIIKNTDCILNFTERNNSNTRVSHKKMSKHLIGSFSKFCAVSVETEDFNLYTKLKLKFGI